jgi:hypothetical protein
VVFTPKITGNDKTALSPLIIIEIHFLSYPSQTLLSLPCIANEEQEDLHPEVKRQLAVKCGTVRNS